MHKDMNKYIYQKTNVTALKNNVEKNYSLTIAGGLKINYSKTNGFSLKVLNIDDIQKENKTYTIGVLSKGSNINIYC